MRAFSIMSFAIFYANLYASACPIREGKCLSLSSHSFDLKSKKMWIEIFFLLNLLEGILGFRCYGKCFCSVGGGVSCEGGWPIVVGKSPRPKIFQLSIKTEGAVCNEALIVETWKKFRPTVLSLKDCSCCSK